MNPFKALFVLCSVFSFFSSALGQVNSETLETENVQTTRTILSTPSDGTPFYVNNLQMREDRKVGVGIGVGGVLGALGAQLELNIEDENAALLGFGMGQGFSTFHLQWKHSFEGQYFTPYFSTGFSRWYNSQNRNLNNASYVLDIVLDESTRQSGPFGADFLVGTVGMQFNQLDGDWSGAGFFVEIELLGSINKSVLIPSGSLGAVYYF